MKKLFIVLLTILVALFSVSVAYAVPGNVTYIKGVPSNTSIMFTWTIPNGATTTMLRVKDGSFPANTGDGTEIYNGVGFQFEFTGLTAGKTYFVSAWGNDGAWSAAKKDIAVTTLAVALPSGGQATSAVTIPSQSISGYAAPPTGTFNLEPFSGIIRTFVGARGLNMPVKYGAELLLSLLIVAIGLIVYISQRNFFIAFVVVFVLSFGGAYINLLQWWLVGIELAFGLGIWALENYFQ